MNSYPATLKNFFLRSNVKFSEIWGGQDNPGFLRVLIYPRLNKLSPK